MKKVISVIICFSLMFVYIVGIKPITLAQENSINSSNDGKIDIGSLIKKLGIVDEDLEDDSTVTRAQVVQFVLNLRDIKDYSSSGTARFLDIPKEHAKY